MGPIDAYVDELLAEAPPAGVPAVDAPNGVPDTTTYHAPPETTLGTAVTDVALHDAARPDRMAADPRPFDIPASTPNDNAGFIERIAASIGAATAPLPSPAMRAAAACTPRHAPAGERWLRVSIAGDSYAFELLRVQEVVRVAPIVAMRGAAHAVLGVMNLRGRIVPVFDLGLWLDVGAVRVEERSRVVVIERDDELIGVLVTGVEDVVSLTAEHIEAPLPGADPGPTLGVARVSQSPTVLLDADALFGAGAERVA